MVLGNSYDIARGEWRLNAGTLINAQEFWFAALMTILYDPISHPLFLIQSLTLPSIATPWVTLRQVPVEVEIVNKCPIILSLSLRWRIY